MAVSPKQLLEAAQELAQGNREVDFRNAASRAYCAAYHRCRPVANATGFERPNGAFTATSLMLCAHPPSRH